MSFHIRWLTQQEGFVHVYIFPLTLSRSKLCFQLFKQIETVYLHLPKKIKTIINKQQVALMQMCFIKNAELQEGITAEQILGDFRLICEINCEQGFFVELNIRINYCLVWFIIQQERSSKNPEIIIFALHLHVRMGKTLMQRVV